MSAFQNSIGRGYVVSSTYLSIAIVLVIFIVLFISSYDAFSTVGWKIFTLEWNPSKDKFGVLSMIYGTLSVTFIALLIAMPLGVLTAIFISEILPEKFRLYFKSAIELLAGIPSIIYGLIGIAFFSGWVSSLFELATGRTILTAGILLSIMVLPTIITLSEDALHNIPKKYREVSKGLGLYPFETITKTLLPIAKNDIIGAILLALGRALGETMAVMLLIGSIDRIPDPFYNFLAPGQTITSKLGREIGESAFGSLHFSALNAIGFLLLLIVITLTIITQFYFKKEDRL
ncbi:phosphate ABC transporter permease subunit PstC [Aequorivita soesokkakensis]|jgi:phosphate ABC transporter permease protein PstC|uniref:Phosphate transport system permease protein n=1 Tax=Aequorivita soesokkakensis TaxID=1385699 RepID=A0A1A9LE33_9FLAO|nr:phosphate ABC transporter permease subunit PstC [Aequorivita soesokkakensis]OAD91530.1 phosphate ABC transporter permease subunit PstC [Aequorivita soesokkakensis]